MSQIIGKVGMTPRGMYERTRAYERLDVVTYQGSSWVAIVDVPAQISPALGSDYWQLQARMGETGPQGPVGPQGNSAFDGTGVELVNNLTQGGQTAALSAEQGKILKQELTELESKENIVAIHSNANDFRAITFVRGETISASGEFLSNARRIVTPSIIYTSDRVTIIADNGFRFYLALYNANGSYIKETGWLTSRYTIHAKTYFRIIIARTTEVTGEVADISEFASSVKFTPEWYENVNKISNIAINSAYQIANVTFIRSDIRYTGEFLSSTSRAASADILHTLAPITISIADGYRFYVALYNTDGTINKNTEWKTSEYIIPAGTYFRIVISRVLEDTSETINVQEFVNALTNEPQWLTNIKNNFDTIINAGPYVSIINKWVFINGDINTGTGDLLSCTSRATTQNICYADKDVTITSLNNSSHFYVVQYTSEGNFRKSTGWQTSKTISAGTYFRIVIAKVEGSYNEIITVEELTKAIGIELQWVSSINQSEFSFQPVNNIWNFINGDTSATNGAIISAEYRVVTQDICNNAEQTTLKVGSGFKFFLALYHADGSYRGTTGWQTSEYLIPERSYFRIVIARTTEVTSETADIKQFTNAVRVAPKWYATIVKKHKENPAFLACVTPRKVRYIQHRGMITVAPENSIPAFVESGKRGAFGVECDVNVTSDGMLVLMHDGTIDRTTNGSGKVSDYNYAQLQQYHIDNGSNIENYTATELVIPTLEDYLKICKRYGMLAVIEIKFTSTSPIKSVIELIHKYGMKDSCMIMTYQENIVQTIRNIDESINITYLVSTSMAQNTDGVDAFVEKYKDMPNFGYTLDYNDFADKSYLLDLVRRIESYNQIVCMCTADTTDKENIFVEMFPDIIITDAGTIL